MSKLQTKSGVALFTAMVQVAGVELAKEGAKVVAFLNGEKLGTVQGETVVADGKKLKIESLASAIDPAALVGKDPTTLTQEELIALTTYLQGLAAGKLNVSDKKEAKGKAEKAAEKKTGKKVEAPVEEEEETEEAELPEGVESIEDLEKMGAKDLWKLAKPLNLEGINSRTKKDDLVEALAEHFGLEADEEEEDEDIEEDALPESMTDEDEEEYDEDEEDEDDEEEDEDESDDEEDEEEDEDESDEEDDEEEEDDEDEEDEEEDDEDEEDEDDELTPEDIDAMETKEEIMAVIKKHGIKLPKKKLSVLKVKRFIKEALFGDEE